MVLTIEPGVYIPDEARYGALRGVGVRIEDDVLVTREGCKVRVPPGLDDGRVVRGCGGAGWGARDGRPRGGSGLRPWPATAGRHGQWWCVRAGDPWRPWLQVLSEAVPRRPEDIEELVGCSA